MMCELIIYKSTVFVLECWSKFYCFFFFFFSSRRRHTRSYGDWSSDVCSSDLEPPTIRRCANRCEFCFIEGLPKGMRKSLYVRDDDYRLSLACGNFATLSNLKDRDVARMLEYRFSLV